MKRSIIKSGNQRLAGKGELEVVTIERTRWERFVNLILLPWRYVWHGRFKL